jgi:hypothetical protein
MLFYTTNDNFYFYFSFSYVPRWFPIVHDDFIVINVNFKLNIIWIIINMMDIKKTHVIFLFISMLVGGGKKWGNY